MPADTIVDILVPVRNAAATIRSAIESIQRQTLTDLRIIAIDDGSTDATGEILADLAREDPRILVLSGPQQGVVGALNLGLDHVRAEFVGRQDADDLAFPQRLARQIAYLRANPDCVAVGCDIRHIDEHGRPTGTWGRFRTPGLSDATWVPALEPYVPGPVFLARRSAMEAAGHFRPMHVAEDSDMSWRLQEVGRLENFLEVLADYRVHPNSISSRSIRHGRIMAVCSQLSALSAHRRRCGRTDLAFSRAQMLGQDRCSSLAELTRLAAEGLDEAETRWLEIATGAKLIELALYRPFELEPEDCEFIAASMQRGHDLLTPENRASLAQMFLSTVVRLALAGRPGDVSRLMRGSLLLPTPWAWLSTAVSRAGLIAVGRTLRVVKWVWPAGNRAGRAAFEVPSTR